MTAVLLVDPRRTLDPRVELALRKEFALELVRQLEPGDDRVFDVAVIAPAVDDPVGLCRAICDGGKARDVIVLGVDPSLREAIIAIRAGATDFVPDGDRASEVVARVKSVAERQQLKGVLGRLHSEGPRLAQQFPELLGESEPMVRLRERLARVALSEASVLITGETGTGKELVARALHESGPRCKGPFVAINCGGIPRQLMESELFGHVRGAFTDAVSDRVGLLAQASGGTVLLDEVGDMPLELQAKLLRALQERAVRQLGQRHEVPFDARIIASSHVDLDAAVADGRFREDLYFRLKVVGIKVPPLRERGHDVLLLARHFMDKVALGRGLGLTPGAASALLAHAWPGNVRELEHCVAAAAACARYDHVRTVDLPIRTPQRDASPAEREIDLAPLSEVERVHILEVLGSVAGNKALAARLLGVDRKTLYRKLKEYQDVAPLGRMRFDSHAE